MFQPTDFIPDFLKEPEQKAEAKKQSIEEMKTVIMGIAGSAKKRGKKR